MNCQHCGTSFSSARKKAFFCSLECRRASLRNPVVAVACKVCGGPVPLKKVGTRGTQTRICSPDCFRALAAARQMVRSGQWKKSGLCPRCGGPRGSNDRVVCRGCLARHKSSTAKRRRTPEGWLTQAFYWARARAKRDGLAFTLTQDDLLPLPVRCPILGIEIDYERKPIRGAHDDAPSLDRTIESKGYTPGNVRVVSSRANRIKNDGSLAEHRAIVAYMESHRRKRRATR